MSGEESTPPEPVGAGSSESAPESMEAVPAELVVSVAFETEHIAAGSGQVPESFRTEIVEKSERGRRTR
jgi:hypothetical protein